MSLQLKILRKELYLYWFERALPRCSLLCRLWLKGAGFLSCCSLYSPRTVSKNLYRQVFLLAHQKQSQPVSSALLCTYLKVNVAIICAGESRVFHFTTGDSSIQVGTRWHHNTLTQQQSERCAKSSTCPLPGQQRCS